MMGPSVPIPPGRDILVDEVDRNDRVIGSLPRHEVFVRRANFRVVHIFVFDASNQRLLLQQLSPQHRHPGLWGSSAASYVAAGETYAATATRRLTEELGVRARLHRVGKTSMDDRGCTKFITLFTTHHEGPFTLDPTQASRADFWSVPTLYQEADRDPSQFTPTLLHLLRSYPSRRFFRTQQLDRGPKPGGHLIGSNTRPHRASRTL